MPFFGESSHGVALARPNQSINQVTCVFKPHYRFHIGFAQAQSDAAFGGIMQDIFRYDPLEAGSNEIRLLQLEPASSISAPLICDLVHRRLDSAGAYEALSYTWGSSNRSRSLALRGYAFPVTVSLWSSLRHLRSSASRRLLWVDAICINQNDLAEKGVQVPRMRDIYTHARCVLIWLGPSAQQSDLAIATLQSIANFKSKFAAEVDPMLTEREQQTKLIQTLRTETSLLPVLARETDSMEPWVALEKLFHRIWWYRVWIIQEATCKNETIFHCGTSSIEWNDFASACSVLMDCNSPIISTRILQNEGFYRFMHMARFLAQRLAHKDHIDFVTVLSAFRSAEASDLRDKVYAGVGLATTEMRKQIVVNYEDDIVKVYTDAAVALINITGSLDVLAHCDSIAGVQGLSSWVPDWSVWSGIEVFAQHGASEHQVDAYGDVQNRPLYQTSLGTQAYAQFDADRCILNLTGARWDTLLYISSPYLDLDAAPSELPDTVWKLFITHHLPSTTYVTAESMDSAIRRTLVADKKAGFLGIAKERGFAIQWAEQREQGNPEDQALQNTSLSVATFLRRIAITRNGYFGLVPRTAQEGDVVCLLQGAQTPFVLRADGSTSNSEHKLFWKLIGEAYVHGIMDGEAWPPPAIETIRIK